MSNANIAVSPEAKPTTMLHAAKSYVMDGWANVLTGLGTLRGDKRMSATAVYNVMSESAADILYASSDIAATIVDAPVEDALRQWLTFTSEVDGLGPAIDKAMDVLHFPTKLAEACSWARLHGGAAILINMDDSKDLSEPLDLINIRKVLSLVVLTRHELQPDTIQDDITSTEYGEPLSYRLTPTRATTTLKEESSNTKVVIHRSRLLLFYGVKLPPRQRQQNNYWGDSVLNRTENAIRNYDVSNDAVATILQEFNQGVFSMKGLADMLLAGNDTAVQKRMQTVQLARSICRAVVIDADGEKFENIGANVTGVPEMVRTVANRLVAASKMPHTKILGESPSGLGASGESEQADWDNYISNFQEKTLRPLVHYFLNILLSSKQGPTRGAVPKTWAFEFSPLKMTSEAETQSNREKQAIVDEKYIERGVLSPIEIRKSRFGGGKYSYETVIESDELPELPFQDNSEEI